MQEQKQHKLAVECFYSFDNVSDQETQIHSTRRLLILFEKPAYAEKHIKPLQLARQMMENWFLCICLCR